MARAFVEAEVDRRNSCRKTCRFRRLKFDRCDVGTDRCEGTVVTQLTSNPVRLLACLAERLLSSLFLCFAPVLSEEIGALLENQFRIPTSPLSQRASRPGRHPFLCNDWDLEGCIVVWRSTVLCFLLVLLTSMNRVAQQPSKSSASRPSSRLGPLEPTSMHCSTMAVCSLCLLRSAAQDKHSSLWLWESLCRKFRAAPATS